MVFYLKEKNDFSLKVLRQHLPFVSFIGTGEDCYKFFSRKLVSCDFLDRTIASILEDYGGDSS